MKKKQNIENNKKIKTLFILPSLGLGGAERVFVKLLDAWKDKTIVLSLLVINKKHTAYQIENPNVEVVLKDYNKTVFSFFFLRKFIKQQRPDVVITTSLMLNLLLLLVKTTARVDFKLLIRDNSVSSIMEKYGAKKLPGVVNKILNLSRKKLYPKADKIICQSKDIMLDVRNALDLKDGTKLEIIANPLDYLSPKKKGQKSINRPLIFICVARFMPVKGHARLLRAFSCVKRPFLLKLVGDGPLQEQTRRLAKEYGLEEKVIFTGVISPPYPELEKADVFVQASFVEGFPNALLESMGMGIPAIAYNVKGGTKEIINPKNGILIQDNNEEAFVKAIESFDTNSFDPSGIKSDVYERFGIEKIVKQYQKLILN